MIAMMIEIGELFNVAGVAPERERFLAAGRVPQLHGPVAKPAGEPMAVRAEGNAVDTVMRYAGNLLPSGRLPDDHRAIGAA